MDRAIIFTFFMSLFVVIYLAINSYIFYRLFGMLGWKQGVAFYSFIAAATLALPLATLAEKNLNGQASRVFYIASSMWAGVLLFLVSFLLLYEIARLVFPLNTQLTAVVIISLTAILSVAAVLNARTVNIKEITVPVNNLKKDVKVVQLSDLHLGTIRNSAFLKSVVEKVNAQMPDIVVITGDMVDGSAPIKRHMLHDLDNISCPLLFVTGNHEIYEGLDQVYELLVTTPAIILDNKMLEYNGIQFIGIAYTENASEMKKAMKSIKINKDKPAILLYHEPRGMEYANASGVDLMLAGHTHNGQIYPFNLMTRLAYSKNIGLHKFGSMYLYVSPGTGTWGPYMRLGSRNEITVVNLKPADS